MKKYIRKNYHFSLIAVGVLTLLFSPIIFAVKIPERSGVNVLSSKESDWAIGLGNYCEQIDRVQTDDKGTKNICTFRPFLSTEMFLKGGETFHYGLFLGGSFPQSPKDDLTHRMVVLISPTVRIYYDYFHFQTTLGMQVTRIWGDGGEVTLNNGNSTQTFNVPDQSRFSYNMVLSLGVGYSLFDSFTLNSDLYVIEARDSDKRAFSLLLQMKYHFGEIF